VTSFAAYTAASWLFDWKRRVQVVRRARLIGIAFIFSCSLLVLSCSNSSKSVTSTGLQFTAPVSAPSIDAGQTVSFTVNQPVTWSLQVTAGKPVGTLTNPTSTSVSYTSPAASTVSSTIQVSVVATLVSDTTQFAIMPVVINPSLTVGEGYLVQNTSCAFDPITSTTQLSDGTVGVTYPSHGANPGANGGTAPYTWTISAGSLPSGLTLGSSGSTAFIQGTPSVSGCAQATLQVTDATGETATTPNFFLIITPPPLKVQVPNTAGDYSGVPIAPYAVTVSGGQGPYTNWSIYQSASGPLPTGVTLTPSASNSSVAVISGTPNATPSSSAITAVVQVEDSQYPYPARGSAGVGFYVQFTQPTNPCMAAGGGSGTNPASLMGSYAFLLRGFDANGPVVMTGSFAADGAGNVTGGVEDVMRTTGSQTGVPISGGSYLLVNQSDNVLDSFSQSGCLALTTSAGTTTFSLNMGGCSTSQDPSTGNCLPTAQNAAPVYTAGRLIEFDDNTGNGTRGSGIVRLQDSTTFATGLNGSYAFGLSGWDTGGGRFAAAGSFSAGSGSLSSVAADINDAGTLQSAVTAGTGTLSALDTTTGRGTVSMTVGSLTFSSLTAYQVNATEVILASTGTPGASNPFVAGEAISNNGPFSNASLQNSHIFHTAGLSGPGPDPNIGILQFDGIGSFSGTQYENQAGTISTTSLSGSYSVDGNSGRLLLWAPTVGQNVGDHPLVGYMITVPGTLTRQSCVKPASCVTGFVVSTDASAQAGLMEFQTPAVAPPPPFSSQYVSGYYYYGSEEGMDDATSMFAGSAKANPNGTSYNGILSASYPNAVYCQQPNCAVLLPNETFAGGYSINSNGSGTVGGQTVSVTNGNAIFYLDESPLDSHPSVMVAEQ
jgi:hypothetical protein